MEEVAILRSAITKAPEDKRKRWRTTKIKRSKEGKELQELGLDDDNNINYLLIVTIIVKMR